MSLISYRWSFIFFLIISASEAISSTFYVSPSGENGATGSFEDPFFLIQEAIDSCTENTDTIYLMEGTYWQHFTIALKSNILISSLDPSNPSTLSGSGVEGLNQIEISAFNNIRISHIIFREHFIQDANAIYAFGTGSGLFITDCEFFNIGWGNDPLADPESFEPIRQAHAILINGREEASLNNVYIGRNHFHDIIVGNSECITLTGNTVDFLIEDNTIEDITNIGIDIAGHFPWAFPIELDETLNQTRGGRIRRNIVRRCKRPTANNEPAGIYVDGGANVIIDRNEVYDNGTGISIGCENFNSTASDIIVANNLVYNNDKFGTVFGANSGNIENCTLRNNTHYNNGIFFDNSGNVSIQKSSNSLISDNIVYLTSNDFFGLSAFGYLVNNLEISRNLFYNESGETSRLYVFSPAEGSSFTENNPDFADPLFTDTDSENLDFSLMDGSPAINQGNPLFEALPEELDFYGSTRLIELIDIGASESDFVSGIEDERNIEFVIYPNPTSDYFTIDGSSEIREIYILNCLGAVVFSREGISQRPIRISTSHLKPGAYIIHLRTEKSVFAKKLVVE
jgi:hypothetical protein